MPCLCNIQAKRKKIGRDTWGGAGVIVTADKNRKGYKSDFVLVTQHADVVGWYFNRIKPVAYSLGNIDYFTKLRFFYDLAKAVSDLPDGADEKQVFDVMVEKTRDILMLTMELAGKKLQLSHQAK